MPLLNSQSEPQLDLQGRFILFAGRCRPTHLVGAESCRGTFTVEQATDKVLKGRHYWAQLCEWRHERLVIVAEWNSDKASWAALNGR
jgi:hypothetical protein